MTAYARQVDPCMVCQVQDGGIEHRATAEHQERVRIAMQTPLRRSERVPVKRADCKCCWTRFEGDGRYCPACVRSHGTKLAPTDANGLTTCPEALRTSRERDERLAAMPAPSLTPREPSPETAALIATIEPGHFWRGNR